MHIESFNRSQTSMKINHIIIIIIIYYDDMFVQNYTHSVEWAASIYMPQNG